MNLKSLPKIERPREKLIKKYLTKTCVCCGRKIKVNLYKDRSYRGGHYFGKVLSKEYWECPKCYRGEKPKNRDKMKK